MVCCLVSDSYPLAHPFGGIAVYTQTAARVLSERGHQVHVVVGSYEGEREEMDGAVHVHYVKIRWLPLFAKILPAFGESLRLARAIRALHRRYHFDILEFPNFEGIGLAFQVFNSLPVVVRLHTSMAEIAAVQKRPLNLGERFGMWAEKRSARCARGVVTHSIAHRDRLARIYGLPEIHLIEHGIVVPEVRAEEIAPLSVLSVGRLTARKGGATLLAAIARVHEQVPGATFTIVGASDGEEAIRHFRVEHPLIPRSAVICREWADQGELDALYRASAIYVSASIYESFGLTFIEAMGRGLPVVGCGVSAMNEIITHEATGLLVSPDDPEAFAAAIVRLLRDAPLRARFGQQGRRVVLQKYTAERMGAEIETWYQNILAKCAA